MTVEENTRIIMDKYHDFENDPVRQELLKTINCNLELEILSHQSQTFVVKIKHQDFPVALFSYDIVTGQLDTFNDVYFKIINLLNIIDNVIRCLNNFLLCYNTKEIK